MQKNQKLCICITMAVKKKNEPKINKNFQRPQTSTTKNRTTLKIRTGLEGRKTSCNESEISARVET